MNEQPMNAQPMATRPGLKPVGDLFRGAWDQYQKHSSVLIGIMLLSGIGVYIQSALLFFAPSIVNQYGTPVANMSGGLGILTLIASVIAIIGSVWGYAAVINKINNLSKPMGVKESFMAATKWIWPVFATGLIAGVLTLIGFILLVIPGIIVAVFLCFSLYIVVTEDKKYIEALKASKAYVDGYWLPVFGRLVALIALLFVVMFVVGIVFGFLDYKLATLGQNIVSLIISPFIILYMYSMYQNIKQIKGGAAPASQI